MKQILYSLFSSLMYIYAYIEIFINNFKKTIINSSYSDTGVYIFLINTQEESSSVVSIKNDELLDNIESNYDFGIIEKKIKNKKCHYLFNEIDTNDINDIFMDSIDQVFYSVEIYIEKENITYSLPISNINYFFKNNILFFKDHVIYLLRKEFISSYIDIDIEYKITIIDHLCNNVTLTNNQYIKLINNNELLYTICYN